MEMKMAKKTDWSSLDGLALDEIAGRIPLYQDVAALRMVCTSWRSSLQDFKFKCRMPWLMLQPKEGSNLYEFFIFPQVEQVQGGITQQHLAIPESDIFTQAELVLQGTTSEHLLHFSSKGWLLDIVEWPLSFSILHPFSGTQIKLPQWPKNPNVFVVKFVLSSNPSFTLNYMVMLLLGGKENRLLYSKPGDKAWTTINTGQKGYLHDVIYFEGKFYIVNCYCQIMACDVTGDNQTMIQVANMPKSLLEEDLWYKVYNVESSRRRLLVVTQVEVEMVEWHLRRGRKTRRGRSRKTTYGIYEFQVFEVDLSTNSWTKMKDLGNKTLFLNKYSFSICIESDSVYFKPNRIFFMDRYDMDAIGVYKRGGTRENLQL